MLRRPPLGPGARHRPRHGPRAPHHLGPRAAPTCPVPPTVGLCTDDAVNGAPFYVMEFVDGHGDPRRTPRPRRSPADAAAPGRRVARRHAGRDPRRRRRRRRARRPRPQGGLRRPPAQALVRPVAEVEAQRREAARRSTTSTTGWPRDPASRAATDRPRRLPPRQLHARRRRRDRRGARLGALHARRPARRRRPAVGLLGRPRRRPPCCPRPRRPPSGLPHASAS